MFKLESYITPIILNHVAKYVKNIRPEDSQVSLWEGEVAFQNLDLRLDVLEEELNLPFEFLSGHVHELSILVPWTKINSEPIKITINTIEFVLKLKDANTETTPSPKKAELKKRLSKVDDGSQQQQQQGYMPGLVNKIINNIVINCHNIILKYVEEDIVVSMNIQLLSFSSADESWKPAFTDIQPVRVFMRKLVQVSDLTICLDKRNAAGQIDVCQEPILYRCSLEIRIVRKYNTNTAHLGSITRIAIFTKLMEMNVSSLQFPMAMRLFKLLFALKGGEFKDGSMADVRDEDNEIQEGTVSVPRSYLSWAWNLIPNFGFSEPEEEEKIEEDALGKLLDIGIYIEALNFTLKSSEFIADSIFGATKKIRYTPIVKLMLGGIYSESVIITDKDWSNTKAGCSSIAIEPLQKYRDEGSKIASLVSTAPLRNKNFLDRSLFDETFFETDWNVFSIEEYNVRVTEEYLLYRSPTIAFDLVDYKTERDTDISANEAEENTDRRRVNYRIFLSSMTLRYNQTFCRILAVLQELIRTYDYPPYGKDKLEAVGGSPKLHPPLLDDFDSLMIGIPVKVYNIKVTGMRFEIHPKTEPLSMKSSKKLSFPLKGRLPYFQLAIQNVEGQWTTPLVPDKLVHTTCQLPDKPIELLNACYENAQIRFQNISLNLMQELITSKVFNIPKGSISFGDLLQPSLWKNEEVPVRKLDLTLESIVLDFSKKEMITVMRLIKSIGQFDSQNIEQISQLVLTNEANSSKVHTLFKKLNLEIKQFCIATMLRGGLKSMQSHVVQPGFLTTDSGNCYFSTTKEGQRNKWLEWYVQMPNDCTTDVCTKSVVALWMEEYNLYIDERLLDFLRFMEPELRDMKEPTPEAIPSAPRTPLVKPQPKKSIPSERLIRRTCCPEETVHVSSERDEKINIETKREKEMHEQFPYSKMLPYIKSMIIKVRANSGHVRIALGPNLKTPHIANFTQITMPRIVFASTAADRLNRFNIQNECLNQNAKTFKDTFPWTCGICDFAVHSSLNGVKQQIIHPIQTAITIAMTHKKETLSTAKNDQQQPQQQPKVVLPEESETEKQKAAQSSKISSGESTFSVKAADNFIHKIKARSSISAFGTSSEESENKGSEKRKSLLQEAVETVFLGRKRAQMKDIVAINLHADTTPIHVEFNSERIQLMRDHVSLFFNTINLLHVSQGKPATQQLDEIQIVTRAEENPGIKQFLELDSSSESSMQSPDKPNTHFGSSILFQWTITKFTVELNLSEQPKFKMILDMEDLISSVDKREDFTKFTVKVGTLNTQLFDMKNDEYILNDGFRIKMQTNSTQSPLFNMIITTVGVKNFFKKIGAKRKDVDVCRALTEIIIKMEAIEMIVDMDKLVVLAPVILTLAGSKTNDIDSRDEKETEVLSNPCTACQLPMIHLDSKGFTIYLPTESKKPWCSVAILKVGLIKISPNLDNPLQRCPVRPDVYQKAAQMGILSTPGSLIEDRQYEVTLQNISAATANWSEILAHMKEHTDNFHNTNPAFEWNNQSRKTTLDLRKVFSNFTFIVVYAPCITCSNALICGQAVEFNCSTDLVASLTIDQIGLFSCIACKMGNLIEDKSSKVQKPKKTVSQCSLLPKQAPLDLKPITSLHSLDTILDASQRPIDEASEKPVTDSGFSSGKISSTKKPAKDTTACCQQSDVRHIPHTTSLVAGTFVIKLYNYTRTLSGIPQGDELTVVETLKPLISIDLSQPSFLISQTIYEVTKRFSLFNLKVTLYDASDTISSNDDFLLMEEEENIPIILFDTKRGQLSSSGIPPPFAVLKSHASKSKKLEIDLTISKPATVRVSPDLLKSLTKHTILYYGSLLENPAFKVCSEKPVYRASKIQMIRNMFLNADRFDLKLVMFSVKFSEPHICDLKLSLMDLRLSAKFLGRPEKLNAKGSIGGLYLQSDKKIIVHPIGVKCNVDLVQESWNRLPLMTANLKLNVINCNIAVEFVKNYSQAIKLLNEALEASNSYWEDFLQNRIGETFEINRDRLARLQLPGVEPKKTAIPKDEFYQDDLRAGAFQFVEMVSDTFLPMPYQIQIIKKNYGIICWRYPQPRKMYKIHIFPVPMAVPNPIRIKCRMEYFSDAHEGFLHYCDFWLSETVSKSIELPEREVTAHIWRVVILQSLVSINRECFDTSEEDEELRSIISIGIDEILNSAKKESDFILHPKVLVGCMRIDTVFRPSAIPKLQILLNINEIQINFQNHQSILSKVPKQLKRFTISEENKPINQTFLTVNIEKTSFHVSFHTLSNYSVHSELTIDVKTLDYGYLNLIYLMEQAHLNGYFKVNENAVDSNIVADKIGINMGPSILHTLICSKQNWEIFLKEDGGAKETLVISKFMVANRTQTSISFGQTGTNERINLESMKCCKYSFQSNSLNQEFTYYISDGDAEHVSDSVAITLDFPANTDSMVKHVRLHDKLLVVRTRRRSATQYYILLKGQIELMSMANDLFQMEFFRDNKTLDNREYVIEKKDRVTFLQRVTFDSNIFIRLRLEGARGKGQTGNIPLKSNKNYPWLVKVPVSGSDKFISYWVRIMRECITELKSETYHPQKILISIWPIFEIQSMMTCPMHGLESSTQSQFTLSPKGKSYQLHVPATHQTNHQISFSKDFKSAPSFNLTLKAIDWNKFFWYDEKVWTVEKTLTEMTKPAIVKWPMNDEEEMRIVRPCMSSTQTSLLYKCFPSRETSCTLSLLVAPWGTFINTTALKISIRDLETDTSIEINANAVAMLPMIKNEFIIEVLNGHLWVSSLPIVFNQSVDTSKRKCYRLEENNFTDIVILKGEQICKFHLNFWTENERNIFILKPKYVMVNMSKQSLAVLPFALDHKESIARKDITKLAADKQITLPMMTSSEYSVGICLDLFYDSNVNKATRSTDTAFIFFVCVKLEEHSEISIPIALMHPFNRKCFSLQQNESSVPLSASLLEKDGQYYVSIYDDTSPMFLLSNQTDLTLIVSQTNTAENSKVSNTIPEYDGRHFEWHQISRPRSILYYTPPTSYASFPDAEPTVCNLSLALFNENHTKKDLKWSKTIHTDASWEKFLHVPSHGDVKIVVCDRHRIIRVSIFYIAQQLEFSVKDLRSRLLTPSDSPENIENYTDDADAFKDEPLQRLRPTMSFKCIHQSPDPTSIINAPVKIRFSVNEINVNIFVECKTVDYLKKEIFALYVDDFLLKYDNSKRTLNLLLSNLQIDNQLFSSGNYDFPVVLCSQELYKSSPSPDSMNSDNRCLPACHPNPMAEITAVFYDDELKIRSIGCRVSPIRAYIEDTYLNDLLDYLLECAPSNVVSRSQFDNYYVELQPGEFLVPKDIVAQALYISEPLRMQYFRIDSMNVMLSVHTCVRLYIALDHSPLQFSTYERRDVLTLPLRFGHTLGMHYLSGALFGAGWVVGSLEMLGSPSGLARSFSAGLKDFVSMPVQGLLRGPWGFVVGVTQGSASLLRNITAGTVNSVSKLAASVSRNLDRLTLDPEHIQRTEALRRSRPQGFTEGFTQGITGLGISILGAVGGIARHALEARSPAQVVTGMGKGIVGALAKPISGAAELLALTGQGVLHTVGFNAMPYQRAPSIPRNIAAQVSEQKVWNQLLNAISSVMEKDQIHFYHEITLLVKGRLRPGSIFLTSSFLALFDTEKDYFIFIHPAQKLDVSFDPIDKTLVNISVTKEQNEREEGSVYTNRRIMSFLHSSSHHLGTEITSDSLDDIVTKDSPQENHSFYINEHLGQYLIEYLKIMNVEV